MVGIKDIAKKAGVSISTVSYALNNSPKVTEETRARIKAIADEMNYVPNMAARTLKRRQTNLIGVYLTDYGGSFYGELLEGIKKGLAEYNYGMIVSSGEKSHLFIPEGMIDGAIILDWTFTTEEIEKYADQGFSLVVLDRELTHEKIPQILLDNRGGTTLAAERLYESSASKVYVISGPKNGYDSQERLQTSMRELTRFGIQYEVVQGNFTEESGYKAAETIFASEFSLPIYIFALNDEMAIGVYKYLRNTTYEIGKDVHIIGFDNIELGAFIRPRLSTVAYSKHRWGMVAAEKVVQLIQNGQVENERIYTTLIPGESLN